MKKITKNKGISLIVLVVTIIVAIILVSTVTITAVSAIDNSKKVTLASDLKDIEDAVESYYITNFTIPSIDNVLPLTKDEVLTLTRSKVSAKLNTEITENEDLSSQFYKIDLSKINVTKTAYGNKKLGESDIFVIAYPSFKAYYVYGIDVGKDTYFSITSKISSVSKVDQPTVDNSVTTIITSGNVKVIKNNGWANKMGVNIEADMAPGETLYMSVSGFTNRLITTTVGMNKFSFDLLSNIINNKETIKVPSLTLAEANYIEEGIKPLSERYVDILKYKGSEIIGKVRIDLSNFSKKLPTITSAVLSSYDNMNTVKLQLASSGSGIKEVRYEYYKKYTDNAEIDNYYNNITDFDSTYLLSKGKKAKIANDLTTTINAPKNVQMIKVAVVDKAGNVNLYNQRVASNLYIGYSIDENIQPNLKLIAKITNISEAVTVKFSKSIDGVTYTDETSYSLPINTLSKQHTFTNVSSSKIYVKISVNNANSTIKETRVITVNMKDALPIPTWDKPYIPKGFSKSTVTGETEVATGLVIKDNNNGNEFVWIPVANFSNFNRVEYNKGWTVTQCTEDKTDPELAAIYASVEKYGGYYIARYEAGLPNIATPATANHNTVCDGTIKPVSKLGVSPWNFIPWGANNDITNPGNGAVTVARSMYNNKTDIQSTLIYGVQWDAALEFIKNYGIKDTVYATDSTNKGNYTGTLKVTGSELSYKLNNIYDMAGNDWEYTMEKYSTSIVTRGGGYFNIGTDNPTSYRYNDSITNNYVYFGFRPSLYIK